MMAAPESSPLAARFAKLAQTQGAQAAITFRADPPKADGTQAYDFAKFWRRVARVTAHLQATWQVQSGDRVAWLGLNHELQLVTLVACARLGAVFVPLNFRLAIPELQQIMQDAQPGLLVHDTVNATTAQALIWPGKAGHPNGGPFPEQQAIAEQKPIPQCRTTHHDRLIDNASPRAMLLPVVGSELPLLLVYTSGTTGLPKGALHTQAGLMANARASAWAHDFGPRDKMLSTLPLFHVGGLCIQTLPALLAGVEVVLHPRFEPSAWLDEMHTSQPSLSLLVPATMRALFEHPRWASTSLDCLRGIMTGSSTVPMAYLHHLHTRGVPVGQIYGTTETGPISIVLRLPEAMSRVGAAGWPQPEAQVKLIDARGDEVGTGQTGEVCVRASNLMQGYWCAHHTQPHAAPAAAPDAGPDAAPDAASVGSAEGLQRGWFHTGDLGQRAPDGCITIVGRSKDMVISGGENIYPAEIENQLISLPGVAECAVLGLPDARWGEVPVAVLVRSASAEGQSLSVDAVQQHLLQHIARFKLPRRVVFVQNLPKSALGKVLKPALAQLLTGTNP